jgi:uncharacterized protein YbaA (DUF1428 family)
MPFFEGFLTPVPTANKDAYLKHATGALDLFRRLGATRFVESWGDDVPDGKTNDLKQAVQLKDDETVLFSWIEYPDRETRDAANAKMMDDPAMAELGKDMPFDGSRMIYAGFDLIAETGAGGKPGYIDGVIVAVPDANKDAYLAFAQKTDAIFAEYGAVRVVDGWGADVPDGKVTDYNRAAHRQDGETVVYGWVEWPDKATRDTAWGKIMADERMGPDGGAMPFDGKRMMFGGFTPILDERGDK